jgi:hypothetical protein
MTMTPDSPIVRFSETVLGFHLWPGQEQVIREWESERPRLGIWRMGRRSGKSRLASLLAVWSATANAAAYLSEVPPGETIAVVVLSRSTRLARVTMRMIRGFLQSPALSALVASETTDSITLRNGIEIVVVPAHSSATRGMAVAVCLADEIGWWAGIDGSPLDPEEVVQGFEPSLAQFDAGFILAMSTPRLASGWLKDASERAASGRFPDVREWWRETSQMNVQIRPAWLAQKEAEDPVAFNREYRALFEQSISAALDPDLVRAAVRDGPESLPPLPDRTYLISLDPAFASGGDTFAALCGHREPDGRVIVDRILSWRGAKGDPVRVDAVLDEIAALSAGYSHARVITDQWAAIPLQQAMEKKGLRCDPIAWTSEGKVAALASLRRCLYASRLEIPNHRKLVFEMLNLEQRAGPSGRPKVAAPSGQHDDFVVALLQLCAALDAESPPPAGGYADAGSGDDSVYSATRERPDRPRGFGLGSVDRNRRARLGLLSH